MGMTELIIIAVLVLIVLYVWNIYNTLATAKVRIREALSNIDVQLKRRIDLIPNLIETVKGYTKHEKTLLENVTKARTSLMRAQTLDSKIKSDNMLEDALKSLFAVSENYPDLKASANFLELQEELEDTENKIAYSRQFYNTNIRDYNTTLANFPSGQIGRAFGFKEEVFFEAEKSEREPVKVSF
jgi:LemA protein